MKYEPALVIRKLSTHAPARGCGHHTALKPGAASFTILSGIDTRSPFTTPSAVTLMLALSLGYGMPARSSDAQAIEQTHSEIGAPRRRIVHGRWIAKIEKQAATRKESRSEENEYAGAREPHGYQPR